MSAKDRMMQSAAIVGEIAGSEKKSKPTASIPEQLISVQAACAAAQISRSQFYRCAARGDFELVKLGRHTKVVAKSFRQYLRNLPRFVSHSAEARAAHEGKSA